MKKIYTFTLDDEVPSDELFNDVKVIAHLLYDDLKNEEDDTKILVTTDKHKENVLYINSVEKMYEAIVCRELIWVTDATPLGCINVVDCEDYT